MKPVDQQFVDDKKGDCLRACVTSVLEVSLEEVPDLAAQGFLPALVKWGSERGLHVIWMDIPDFISLDKIWFGNAPPFFIAWGESPRQTAEGKPKQHAVVVASKGYGVKVAHDPHESRDGLKTMCGFAMILNGRAGAVRAVGRGGEAMIWNVDLSGYTKVFATVKVVAENMAQAKEKAVIVARNTLAGDDWCPLDSPEQINADTACREEGDD